MRMSQESIDLSKQMYEETLRDIVDTVIKANHGENKSKEWWEAYCIGFTTMQTFMFAEMGVPATQEFAVFCCNIMLDKIEELIEIKMKEG